MIRFWLAVCVVFKIEPIPKVFSENLKVELLQISFQDVLKTENETGKIVTEIWLYLHVQLLCKEAY